MEVIQLTAQGDLGAGIDEVDALAGSLSELDKMAQGVSFDLFDDEIREAASIAATGQKAIQTLEDAIRSQGRGAIEAAKQSNSFLDYLKKEAELARKASQETKALTSDIEALSRATAKSRPRDVFAEARRSGLKAPGAGGVHGAVPLPGATVKKVGDEVSRAGQKARSATPDFGALTTQLRDMDGVGLRLGDTLDQIAVFASGPLGAAIGALIAGITIGIVVFDAITESVGRTIERMHELRETSIEAKAVSNAARDLAESSDDVSKKIDDWTFASVGGIRALQAMDIITQSASRGLGEAGLAGSFIRVAADGVLAASAVGHVARAVIDADTPTGAYNAAVQALNDHLIDVEGAAERAAASQINLGNAFNVAAGAAANAASQFSAAARAAASGLANKALIKIGVRRDPLGQKLEAGAKAFFDNLMPDRNKRGGGGGGGKKEIDIIHDLVKARREELGVVRELQRLQEAGTLQEVNQELARAERARLRVADAIRLYAMELETARSAKTRRALEMEIEGLEQEENKLRDNVKILKERRAELEGIAKEIQKIAGALGGTLAGTDKLSKNLDDAEKKIEGIEKLRNEASNNFGLDFAMGLEDALDALDLDPISRMILEMELLGRAIESVGKDSFKMLIEGLAGAGGQMANMFGQMAAGAATTEDLGNAVLSSFGDLAAQIGQFYILQGAAMMFMPGGLGAGLAMVLGGLALQAFGGGLSGAAQGGAPASSRSSGGGGAGARSQLQGQNQGGTVINLNAKFGTTEIQGEVEGMVNDGVEQNRIQAQSTGRRRVG